MNKIPENNDVYRVFAEKIHKQLLENIPEDIELRYVQREFNALGDKMTKVSLRENMRKMSKLRVLFHKKNKFYSCVPYICLYGLAKFFHFVSFMFYVLM